MRYLSVCSGIEAASVAWHHIGWEPVGFSEIEPFPSAVLAHRFPAVPNYGDMTKFQEWPIEPGTIDILVGGTPCQSFSVAGLRQGLADPRGNLMLTYLAIAARFRPRWVVWENVPGVLSSNGGRDFGTFLRALGELGYGWAYRVLDAQYVRVGRWPRAVPQRRRRVFVVGCLGDWTAASEVLAIREGLQRHIAASGKTRKGAASDAEGGVARCVTTGEGKRQDYETCTVIAQPVPYDLFQITAPVNRQNRKPGDPCHTLARDNAAHAAIACVNMQGSKSNACVSQDGSAYSLNAMHGHDVHAVAVGFNWQNGGGYGNANDGLGITVEGTGPLQRCNTPAVAFTETSATIKGGSGARGYPDPSDGNGHSIVGHAMTVRRLTPRECERLQGFPDDWTLIPWRGKPAEQCPDGPRYKALGNSMACNCMAWIGERIAAVHSRHDQRAAP